MRTPALLVLVVGVAAGWCGGYEPPATPAAPVVELISDDAAGKYVKVVRARHELHPMLIAPEAEVGEACREVGLEEGAFARIGTAVRLYVSAERQKNEPKIGGLGGGMGPGEIAGAPDDEPDQEAGVPGMPSLEDLKKQMEDMYKRMYPGGVIPPEARAELERTFKELEKQPQFANAKKNQGKSPKKGADEIDPNEMANRGVCAQICAELGIRTEIDSDLGESLDALRYGDSDQREEAARDLADKDDAAMKAARAIDELTQALGDSEAPVRAWSARALGNVGAAGAKAVPKLAKMLDEAPLPPEHAVNMRAVAIWDDSEEAASAAYALSRTGPEGQAELVRLLSDEKLERRFWGASGLGESRPGTAEGGDLLLRATDAKEPERLRAQAARALGVVKTPPPGAGGALVAMLDDASVRVRVGAATGLGKLRSLPEGATAKLLSLAGAKLADRDGDRGEWLVLYQLKQRSIEALCRQAPGGTTALAGAIDGMDQATRMMVYDAVAGLFEREEICNQGLGDVAEALTKCDDMVVAGHAAKLRGEICANCLNGCVGGVAANATPRVNKLIVLLDTIKTEEQFQNLAELEDDPVEWPAGEQRALAEACMSRLAGREGVPRRVCVMGLAMVANHATPAVGDLTQVLRDSSDPLTLQGAATTLGVVGAPAEPALPLLRALATRRDEVGTMAGLAVDMIEKAVGK